MSDFILNRNNINYHKSNVINKNSLIHYEINKTENIFIILEKNKQNDENDKILEEILTNSLQIFFNVNKITSIDTRLLQIGEFVKNHIQNDFHNYKIAFFTFKSNKLFIWNLGKIFIFQKNNRNYLDITDNIKILKIDEESDEIIISTEEDLNNGSYFKILNNFSQNSNREEKEKSNLINKRKNKELYRFQKLKKTNKNLSKPVIIFAISLFVIAIILLILPKNINKVNVNFKPEKIEKKLDSIKKDKNISDKEEWSIKLGTNIQIPPIIYNNNIITGDENGYIYSINSLSGEINWKFFSNGSITGKGALKDNILYIGNSTGSLFAINVLTGEKLWEANSDGKIEAEPLLTEEKIIFGTDKGKLYAVNYDGKIIWEKKFDGKLLAKPININNELFVIFSEVSDSKLYDLNLLSGNKLWNSPANIEGIVKSDIIVEDNYLYFATSKNFVYSVSIRGRSKFKKKIAEYEEEGIEKSFTVLKDAIILGSNKGRIYIVDKDKGEIIKETIMGDSFMNFNYILGNKIYLIGEYGKIFSINIDDYNTNLILDSKKNGSSGLIIIDNYFYITDKSGFLSKIKGI